MNGVGTTLMAVVLVLRLVDRDSNIEKNILGIRHQSVGTIYFKQYDISDPLTGTGSLVVRDWTLGRRDSLS